mgnify:CR=1 FL=1
MGDNLLPTGMLDFASGGDEDEHYWHFWSHHPGGAHFAFADTGIRFLNYSMEPHVMRDLSTRDGRELVGTY